MINEINSMTFSTSYLANLCYPRSRLIEVVFLSSIFFSLLSFQLPSPVCGEYRSRTDDLPDGNIGTLSVLNCQSHFTNSSICKIPIFRGEYRSRTDDLPDGNIGTLSVLNCQTHFTNSSICKISIFRGEYRSRTDDLLLAKQAL